jgi:predicted small lipoprotein YifL
MAGCGCKGNQNPPPAQPAQGTTTSQQQNKVVSETIQQSIKKTIEKYYNVNKTQK